MIYGVLHCYWHCLKEERQRKIEIEREREIIQDRNYVWEKKKYEGGKEEKLGKLISKGRKTTQTRAIDRDV